VVDRAQTQERKTIAQELRCRLQPRQSDICFLAASSSARDPGEKPYMQLHNIDRRAAHGHVIGDSQRDAVEKVWVRFPLTINVQDARGNILKMRLQLAVAKLELSQKKVAPR